MVRKVYVYPIMIHHITYGIVIQDTPWTLDLYTYRTKNHRYNWPPQYILSIFLWRISFFGYSDSFEIFAVNSRTNLAATIAVIPSTVSLWGLNSTTSPATIVPFKFCKIFITSRNESPPGSMWETPGANAGSRQSQSIDIYTPFTPTPSSY